MAPRTLCLTLFSCYAAVAVVTAAVVPSTLSSSPQPEGLMPAEFAAALNAGDCKAVNTHTSSSTTSEYVNLWYYTTIGIDTSRITDCTIQLQNNVTTYTSETVVTTNTTIISSDNSTTCDSVLQPPFYTHTDANPKPDGITRTVTASNAANINTNSRRFSSVTTMWNCFTAPVPTTVLQKEVTRKLSFSSTSYTATTCNAATEVVCFDATPTVLTFSCLPIKTYCTDMRRMCIPAGSGGGWTDAALRAQLCTITSASTTESSTSTTSTTPAAPTSSTGSTQPTSTAATTQAPSAANSLTSSALLITVLAFAAVVMFK